MINRSRGPRRSCRRTSAGRTGYPRAALLFVATALLGVAASAQTGPLPLQITKTPGAQDVIEGCDATFDIRVFSPDCRDVSDIDVTDPTTPDCERMDQALACEGLEISYSCVTPPLTASFDNVATVTGLVDDEVPFTATADSTASVTVLPTGVEITKLPATQEVVAGESAFFTIRVTNTGTAPVGLGGLAVVDDQTPDCSRDAAFFDGIDPDLQPTEFIEYTCSTDPLTTGFVNTATVTGTHGCVAQRPPQNVAKAVEEVTLTANASAEVVVLTPSIDLEKLTDGNDADAAPGPTLAVGDTVTWSYVVTNDGTAPLANIAVTDDVEGAITCPATTLEPNESMTCTQTGTVTAGLYANEGSVTAEPSIVTDAATKEVTVVTDADTSHYTGEACFEGETLSGCVTGGPRCRIQEVVELAVGSIAAPPPAGLDFPHGLLDIRTASCDVGGTVDFLIIYPTALPPGTEYWKYGPRPGNPTPDWYTIPATISGNTAMFSITDGGIGDHDLTANGEIDDPGGPAVAAVPTLPQWAFMALAVLLLATGAWLGRRQAIR